MGIRARFVSSVIYRVILAKQGNIAKTAFVMTMSILATRVMINLRISATTKVG